MSKQDRKKISSGKNGKRKSSAPLSTGHGLKWVGIISLSVMTGLIASVMLPRLQFLGAISPDVISFSSISLAALVLCLSLLSSTMWIPILRILVPVGFFICLFSNMAIQFKWVDNAGIISLLAYFLVFPIGVFWAFLLSAADYSKASAILPDSNTSVFRSPLFLGVAAIVLAGSVFMLFYRLGFYDFWEDENLVINAAIGLKEQGADYLSEGYSRAWLHSWLISKSISIFGTSEWSARLPSALGGLAFVLIAMTVFYKWMKWHWIALCIPVICLLTDELLILFRYTRMYALMIPVFLAAMYVLYAFLVSPSQTPAGKNRFHIAGFDMRYGVAGIGLLLLATHLHLLASVGFVVAALFIVLLAVVTRQKKYWTIAAIGGAGIVLVIVLGMAGLPAFKLVTQAAKRLTHPDAPEYTYFQFLFNNGLAANATLMTLIGGTGLFFNKSFIASQKLMIGFFYLLIITAYIAMVYLMADPGRDYRYISHIVPFVIGLQLYILFVSGKNFTSRIDASWIIVVPLLYTGIAMSREYTEVYVHHPWSPAYKEMYGDLVRQYKPGDAILYQNIKTYYLDPQELAGEKAIKLGKRKELSLEQFKEIFNSQEAGWIVFDTHKSYHVSQEIQRYILKRARKVHGQGIDNKGVEMYYFNHNEE